MDEPLSSTPPSDTTLGESDDSTESEPDPKDDSFILAQPAADPSITSLTLSTVPQTVEDSPT